MDAGNNFELSDFFGDKLPPGVPAKAKAFIDERVWHMGIVLAAQQLGLDLAKADVDLPHGKIILRGANGIQRTIPVDAGGNFYVDWRLTPNDPQLTRAPIQSLLLQDKLRLLGETNGLSDDFRGKLAVVIYVLQGNNLTDEGATPPTPSSPASSFGARRRRWNWRSSFFSARSRRFSPGSFAHFWRPARLYC